MIEISATVLSALTFCGKFTDAQGFMEYVHFVVYESLGGSVMVGASPGQAVLNTSTSRQAADDHGQQVLGHKLQHAAVAALASATASATSLSLDCHGLAGESKEE